MAKHLDRMARCTELVTSGQVIRLLGTVRMQTVGCCILVESARAFNIHRATTEGLTVICGTLFI